MNVTSFLENQRRRVLIPLGIGLLALVAIANLLAGPEFEFSIFYLMPVSFFTWFIGRRAGLDVALVSAAISLLISRREERHYFHPQVTYWNAAALLGLYVVLVLIISELRTLYQREREWSHRDDLTNLENRRAFFEALTAEKNRARRYNLPLTLAYFDVDHFKQVNDRWGHSVGDQLLITVARIARAQIRATDMVARVGGDEFALLLPQTNAESAEVVLRKIKLRLDEGMQLRHWPVTFSIGVVTFQPPPDSVQEMVREADEVMYTAKSAGRDTLKIETRVA